MVVCGRIQKSTLPCGLQRAFVCFSRNEATRTPDPYVPNVVRYQLRYIPILNLWCKCRANISIEERNQGKNEKTFGESTGNMFFVWERKAFLEEFCPSKW